MDADAALSGIGVKNTFSNFENLHSLGNRTKLEETPTKPARHIGKFAYAAGRTCPAVCKFQETAGGRQLPQRFFHRASQGPRGAYRLEVAGSLGTGHGLLLAARLRHILVAHLTRSACGRRSEALSRGPRRWRAEAFLHVACRRGRRLHSGRVLHDRALVLP